MNAIHKIARLLLPTLLGCLLTGAALAQPGRPAEERIEAMKVAFITDRLRLSPQESQQFWPLYNQYEEDEKRLRQQYRPGKPVAEMSDREAEEFLNRHLEMEEKLIGLQREYIRRFQGVIPPRKVAMLRQVEDEFKRELLKRLQEWRRGRN